MKFITTITAILLSLCLLTACANNTENTESCSSSDSGKVYICTGQYSHAYHIDRYCKGLQRCSRSIEKISIEKAEELHRHPCRFCAE